MSLAFESETEVARPETKLNVGKSKFAAKSAQKNNFETQAAQTVERMENKKKQAFEISQNFIALLKTQVLPENKGPLEQSLEREIIGKITHFTDALNNDPEEERDGMGSTGAVILLLKSVLILRDLRNQDSYRIAQLEGQLKALQNERNK